MSIDFSVARYLAASACGRSTQDLKKMAHRNWQHAPAGFLKQRQPLFLQDELDRVIDIHPDSSFELERNRLFAAAYEYPATEIFELRSASLLNGQIYAMNGRTSLRRSRPSLRKLLPRGLSDEPSGFIADSSLAWRFFAHWLTDQLATEWLGNHLGYPVFTAERPFRHSDAYRAKLPWHALQVRECRFERLVLARDGGQNPSRVARQLALRDTLRGNWHPIQPNELVYLTSGRTDPVETLVNEQEISRYVEDQGGLVIQPDEMSMRDLATALHGVRLVVGAASSALSHALMLGAETSTLLVIQSPRRFHNVLKTYTDAIGMRYAFAVADPAAEGFRLPIDRLAGLIDFALDAQPHPEASQPTSSKMMHATRQSSTSRR